MINVNQQASVKTNLLNYSKSLENNSLRENDLVRYGKQLSTTKEIVTRVFIRIFHTIKYGFANAKARQEAFYKEKTVKLIQETNQDSILKILNIAEEAINEDTQLWIKIYKETHLKRGEVFQNSPETPQSLALKQLYQFHALRQDAAKNEEHWLNHFKGHLDEIDSFTRKEKDKGDQIAYVLQFNDLYLAHPSGFKGLLKHCIKPEKLATLNASDFNKLKDLIKLYDKFPPLEAEQARITGTIVLSKILNLEAMKSHQKAFEDFIFNPQFMTTRQILLKVLDNTIISVPELLNFKEQITNNPEFQGQLDLTAIASFQELQQKMNVYQQQLQTKSKKENKQIGESKKLFELLQVYEQAGLPFTEIQTLQQLVKSHESLTVKVLFEPLKKLLPKKKSSSTEKKEEKEQVTQEKLTSALKKIQTHTINAFSKTKKKPLKDDEKATEKKSTKTEKKTSSESEEKTIKKLIQTLNLALIEKWKVRYGEPFTEFLIKQLKSSKQETIEALPALVKTLKPLDQAYDKFSKLGLIEEFKTFLQTQDTQFAEIESRLASFDKHTSSLKELKPLLGQPPFASLYFECLQFLWAKPSVVVVKEFKQLELFAKQLLPKVKQNENLSKQIFAQYLADPTHLDSILEKLETFDQLKSKFLQESSLSSEEFNQYVRTFIEKSPNDFVLDQLESFRASLQKDLNEKFKNELANTYQKGFLSYVEEYLASTSTEAKQPTFKEQLESGTISYEQIPFFALSFDAQASYLIPEIARKTGIEETIVADFLLKEGLTQQTFENRLHYLEVVKKVFSADQKSKRLIPDILDYLPEVTLDAWYQSSTLEKNLQRLAKTCRKIDRTTFPSFLIVEKTLSRILVNNKIKDVSDSLKLTIRKDILDAYLTYQAQEKSLAKGETEENCQQLMRYLRGRLDDKHLEEAFRESVSKDYLDSLITFYLGFSDYPAEKVGAQIINAFKPKDHSSFSYHLTECKPQIKADITGQIKEKLKGLDQQKKLIENKKQLELLKSNPFLIIEKLLPALLSELLPEKDPQKIELVKKYLQPLKAEINHLPFLQTSLTAFSGLIQIFETLLPESQALTKMTEQNIDIPKLTADMLSPLEKLNVREVLGQASSTKECMRFLNEKGCGLFGMICSSINDRIFLAQQWKKEGKQDLIKANLPVKALIENLPKIVENQETILKWTNPNLIESAVSFLSNFRLLGLSRFALSILVKKSSLSSTNKTILLKSLKPLIEIIYLALPSLLKHHDLKFYFSYLSYLNDRIENKKLDSQTPEDVETYIRTLEFIQTLIKELGRYGSAFTAAFQELKSNLDQSTISEGKQEAVV